MAGALTISTLNNDTGVLATQNGMTGIAKAWANFDSSGTIASSFNVSSITKNSTGRWTVNFSTAMPNANYAVSFVGYEGAANGVIPMIGNSVAYSTTAFQVCTNQASNGAAYDSTKNCAVAFSS